MQTYDIQNQQWWFQFFSHTHTKHQLTKAISIYLAQVEHVTLKHHNLHVACQHDWKWRRTRVVHRWLLTPITLSRGCDQRVRQSAHSRNQFRWSTVLPIDTKHADISTIITTFNFCFNCNDMTNLSINNYGRRKMHHWQGKTKHELGRKRHDIEHLWEFQWTRQTSNGGTPRE